ncbi:MAG: ATP-binding protein, partial [Desulfobulbus sp.]
MNTGQANAETLERELAWFGQVLEARIALYFRQEDAREEVSAIAPPGLEDDPSEYACLVRDHGMGFEERIVLILALIPHIRPQALDTLFLRNTTLDRGFAEFGGWKGVSHGG